MWCSPVHDLLICTHPYAYLVIVISQTYVDWNDSFLGVCCFHELRSLQSQWNNRVVFYYAGWMSHRFCWGGPTGKFVFTSPDFFEMPTQNKYDNLQECLVVMSMDGILKTSAMQKLLTASSNGGPTCFLGFIPSHTIHGNGIFTYIWLIFYEISCR